MSRWNIVFYIVQWIITSSTLAGWIHSSFSGAHELFGVILMAPFDWYLIFQACIIGIIFINRTRIVRLYKRVTGQTEQERKEEEEKEKLKELHSLIKEAMKLTILKIEKGRKALGLYPFTQLAQTNLKTQHRLEDLGFRLPSIEDTEHEDYEATWYTFLSIVQVEIEDRSSKRPMDLNFWDFMKREMEKPENPH